MPYLLDRIDQKGLICETTFDMSQQWIKVKNDLITR
jgi:hypothetical protein